MLKKIKITHQQFQRKLNNQVYVKNELQQHPILLNK